MNQIRNPGLVICCVLMASITTGTAAPESSVAARIAIQSRTQQWLAAMRSNNNSALEKSLRLMVAPGFSFQSGSSKTAAGATSIRAFITFEEQRMADIYGKAASSIPTGTPKQDVMTIVINGNQATEDVVFAYSRQMTDKQGHPLPSTGKTPDGRTFSVNQVGAFHETDHLTWVKTNGGWKILSFQNVAMTGVL